MNGYSAEHTERKIKLLCNKSFYERSRARVFELVKNSD
jgi:hypothetical protein